MGKIELVNKFVYRMEVLGKSQNTIRDYRNTYKQFVKFLGNKGFDKVTEDDVIGFLGNGNGVRTSSKKIYLIRLNVLFKWLQKQGYVDVNPVEDLNSEIRVKDEDKKKVPEVSIEDVRKIIQKTKSPRDKAILLLLYKTGMRIGELLNLKKSDVDFDTGKIIIRKRKGGKRGYVFIDDEAKKWLGLYLSLRSDNNKYLIVNDNNRKFNKTILSKHVSNLAKEAGYDGITAHSFRHFFTTHLQLNGCHPEVIRILRGDSSGGGAFGMVSYYTHFTEQQVRDWYLRTVPKLFV